MLIESPAAPPLPTTPMIGTEAILRRARELLIDEGWIQGMGHTTEGRCLLGAAHSASAELGVSGLPADAHACGCLSSAAMAHGATSVATYNDIFARSVEDAVALIDEAIVLSRVSAPPEVVPDRLYTGAYSAVMWCGENGTMS